jgi:hypothetical protein
MERAPGPLDDLRRFLPLAQKLAKMNDSDEPRFRHRLRGEPTMGNILDDIKAEGEAKGKAEDAKIAVRNIRRTAKELIDKTVKDHKAGEDEGHRAEKSLDELTAKHVAAIDEILKHKEAELLEV